MLCEPDRSTDALLDPTAPRSKEFDMPRAPFVSQLSCKRGRLLIRTSRYYEDLGVVEDLASSLVIEAFNRQVSVNPARTPHYLGCLKAIGELRGGEDEAIIDRAVQIAYAKGKYTVEDVGNAYRYFGLNPEDYSLTEDSIIDKFYAFLNANEAQEIESRRQLWRIGDFRHSERIKSTAEESE